MNKSLTLNCVSHFESLILEFKNRCKIPEFPGTLILFWSEAHRHISLDYVVLNFLIFMYLFVSHLSMHCFEEWYLSYLLWERGDSVTGKIVLGQLYLLAGK